MGQINRTPIVINTFTSGAADVTISGNNIVVSGLDSTGAALSFSLYAPNGSASGGVKPSLFETGNIIVYTPVAAATSTYSFNLTQFNKALNIWQVYPFIYTSLASGSTATTICNLLKAQVRAVSKTTGGGSLGVTVDADGAATMTITGGTGDPIFFSQITALGGGFTSATGLASAATIASNTTANPTVFTASGAHGLSVGMTVVITTSDVTKFVAGTYRVATVPLSTTFTLTQLDGVTTLAGTSTATGTIVRVAQEPMGIGATILAGIPATQGLALSGSTYGTLIWNGFNPDVSKLTEQQQFGVQQVVYFKDGGTNVAAAIAQLQADFVTFKNV